MHDDIEYHEGRGGILAKKGLWISVGVGIFLIVAFAIPTPQTLIETLEKYGYVTDKQEIAGARPRSNPPTPIEPRSNPRSKRETDQRRPKNKTTRRGLTGGGNHSIVEI